MKCFPYLEVITHSAGLLLNENILIALENIFEIAERLAVQFNKYPMLEFKRQHIRWKSNSYDWMFNSIMWLKKSKDIVLSWEIKLNALR